MSERIVTEIHDHVATVTLNRPAKRNAVDVAMFNAIVETGDLLGKDASVRAVVLRGSGPDFCTGLDVSIFQGNGIEELELTSRRYGSGVNLVQQAALVWRELPVPVIAAISGSAFGAGLQIAMGADIRYGSPDVRMSIMEVRWGLVPDMAMTSTLRHVVRQDHVRELSYTGRIVESTEARAVGLLTAVVDDPVSKARAIATGIAQKSPDAIRAIKALINKSWHDEPGRALLRETTLQMTVLAGENSREAARAKVEERPPEFRDPGS